jgi:hypothetical protein
MKQSVGHAADAIFQFGPLRSLTVPQTTASTASTPASAPPPATAPTACRSRYAWQPPSPAQTRHVAWIMAGFEGPIPEDPAWRLSQAQADSLPGLRHMLGGTHPGAVLPVQLWQGGAAWGGGHDERVRSGLGGGGGARARGGGPAHAQMGHQGQKHVGSWGYAAHSCPTPLT